VGKAHILALYRAAYFDIAAIMRAAAMFAPVS
jgi:hypothetical protein